MIISRLIKLSPLAVMLGACAAPIGDFGRKDTSIYGNVMTDAAGPFSNLGKEQPNSLFAYTDEERELRHRGFTLARPPDRDIPGNSATAFQWWRLLPDSWYGGYPETYYVALATPSTASSETRYVRLIQEARGDAALLPAFRDVASRVGKADAARAAALGAIAADREMAGQARLRIEENRGVVGAVCQALDRRIKAYRYALGRLVVETPSTKAVEADAAIDALRWELGPCSPTGQPGSLLAQQRDAAVRDARRPMDPPPGRFVTK